LPDTHGRGHGLISRRLVCWNPVDWATAIYATFVAALAVIYASAVPHWSFIVLWHTGLVVALVWLPPHGAPWEHARLGEPPWRARTREVFRFLRYTYPALLLTPFFEEVALTVNAVFPHDPHWFEGWLFAADRALFGGIPAVMLSERGGPILDEIMHALYFAYYPLLISGIVVAWRGATRGDERPGAGFHRVFTGMMLGFFLSYVWYPFLPARGPWEHPEVMSSLRPFGGWVFTRIIEVIIRHAAVSGGCFPSAHVSGTWALTFGLYATRHKAARWFGLVALGLSVACVYTRYHHGVDVLAGLTVGAIGAAMGYRLTRRAPNA